YCGDQRRCVPAPNTRLNLHMNRVKYDRDHNRQKDRSEKGAGDEIAKIERNCGQSEQEQSGGCRLSLRELRSALSNICLQLWLSVWRRIRATDHFTLGTIHLLSLARGSFVGILKVLPDVVQCSLQRRPSFADNDF